MTDDELKELVASLAIAQKETDRQLQETDKQLRELGKQIGGLGEKFGGFTEGLALPSMTKILTEHFGMEVVTPLVKVRKQGQTLELDVLAYANSEQNAAFVVEVKSHLRPEGIDQLRQILTRFRQLLPEHADKKLYGILASGLYLAGIHEDQFQLEVSENFQPRVW